jgi:hypothetical protein
MTPSYWSRMTKRERALAGIVLAALLVLGNFILLNFIARKKTQLDADRAARAAEVENLDLLFAEKDLWTGRNEWIHARQPVLSNESTAGVELLDEVKKLAQETGVTLSSPAIGTPSQGPDFRSVSLNFETRSPAESLVRFLHSLQKPERFIALESANLQIDAQDQTKLHGRFRIGKWYAP